MDTDPAPTWARGLSAGVVGLLVAAVAGLTVVDVLVGQTLFGVVVPALGADLALIAMVLVARRQLLVATVLAAAASVAVSFAVQTITIADYAPVVGRGGWPGLAEVAGLAFLTAACIRMLRPGGGVVASASFAAALVAIADWRQHGPYPDVVLLVLAVTLAFTVGTGLYFRALDRRREHEVREVRQDERIAIAHELHDLVAHHVTGIVLQAQAATLVVDAQPAVAKRALADIEEAGADALRSMRAMVGALRADAADAPVAPTATLVELRALASPGGPGDPPVRVVIDDACERLPATVVASAHRIAREAVTNARRHAPDATAVVVDLRWTAGQATLTVTNDGAPATGRSAPAEGFGLTGIAERVEALGGTFAAGPRTEGGWAVAATLPAGLAPLPAGQAPVPAGLAPPAPSPVTPPPPPAAVFR